MLRKIIVPGPTSASAVMRQDDATRGYSPALFWCQPQVHAPMVGILPGDGWRHAAAGAWEENGTGMKGA